MNGSNTEKQQRWDPLKNNKIDLNDFLREVGIFVNHILVFIREKLMKAWACQSFTVGPGAISVSEEVSSSLMRVLSKIINLTC